MDRILGHGLTTAHETHSLIYIRFELACYAT